MHVHKDAPGSSVPVRSPRSRLRIDPWSVVLFAVVFWVLPLVGLFFARFINVLQVIFLAVLLSTFLTPIVNRLERLRIHRGIGILLVYLAVFAVLFFVVWLAIPLFINETQALINTLPAELSRFSGPLHRIGISLPTHAGQINIRSLLSDALGGGGKLSVQGVAGTALGVAMSVGTLAVEVLAILALAFFLTVQRTLTEDLVNALVPPDYRARWFSIMSRMGERMGGWVIGQVIVTIYYFIAFGVGLTIIHLPNALSIAAITGVLEIIPFVGGFLGVVLAVLVALTVNVTTVIWVLVLYVVVTNVEAHVLVPNIYGRMVQIHPALVIAALLFGAEAFGLIGAIIAVPIAAALQVLVENLYVKDVVKEAEEHPRPHLRRPPFDVTVLRRRTRRHDRL